MPFGGLQALHLKCLNRESVNAGEGCPENSGSPTLLRSRTWTQVARIDKWDSLRVESAGERLHLETGGKLVSRCGSPSAQHKDPDEHGERPL